MREQKSKEDNDLNKSKERRANEHGNEEKKMIERNGKETCWRGWGK